MEKKVVTFGEVMLRLTPSNHLRFTQTKCFDAIFSGAEADVAIALSHLGVPADFVTRLPLNDIGDACINYLRQFGVGVNHIIRGGDRIGIYFYEVGVAQRSSKIIYDRANSAFATIKAGMVNWSEVFRNACWFHWTGINPAVSETAAEACLEAVKEAKNHGLTVSCDLNYRSQLWKWGKKPTEVMSELVGHVDIVTANEEDADKVFGIKAPDVDVERGKVKPENYLAVAQKLMKRFPNLKLVGTTLRESISATHNIWTGVLYDGQKLYKTQVYDIYPIIDRIGTGDTFSAGIIYGLLKFGDDLQKTLDFATAMSCLKHTIYGDSPIIRIEEVETLMKGIASGRIIR
ncbi:MAG: sugar kinase [Candidatus Bathyarchaeia archaeon]